MLDVIPRVAADRAMRFHSGRDSSASRCRDSCDGFAMTTAELFLLWSFVLLSDEVVEVMADAFVVDMDRPKRGVYFGTTNRSNLRLLVTKQRDRLILPSHVSLLGQVLCQDPPCKPLSGSGWNRMAVSKFCVMPSKISVRVKLIVGPGLQRHAIGYRSSHSSVCMTKQRCPTCPDLAPSIP